MMSGSAVWHEAQIQTARCGYFAWKIERRFSYKRRMNDDIKLNLCVLYDLSASCDLMSDKKFLLYLYIETVYLHYKAHICVLSNVQFIPPWVRHMLGNIQKIQLTLYSLLCITASAEAAPAYTIHNTADMDLKLCPNVNVSKKKTIHKLVNY